MDARDFAGEIAALEASLPGDRNRAVPRLRVTYEAWARSLLGIAADGELVGEVRAAVEGGVDPAVAASAIDKLRAAEDRQWEIGTWSTGSGEGLASMNDVRALQAAQAWLLAARTAVDAAARDRALALADEVDADPNGMGARHAGHLAALRARLSI